ncbi:ornithine cyclodeaminase family protein [Natrialbaceae archaeon A-CW2]
MQEDYPTPGEMLFLSREDVNEVINAEDCVDRVEDTFRWVGEGKVEQVNPVELWLSRPEDEYGYGNVSSYPAHIEPLDVAGNKWLGVFHRNAQRGLPTLSAVNILNDANTAMPFAMLDGQIVTALRTAGHAGVGAKYLAREDSSAVTIIGCGEEGRTHLRVMNDLFDLDTVNACDIDETARESFIEEMSLQIDAEISGFADAREAVRGADIICMVTTADSPIVMEEWIEPGTHVAATNGFLDLDPEFTHTADKWVLGLKTRDLLWIDGDQVGITGPEGLSRDDVHGDLTELLVGDCAGRESDDERTVMSHMGMPALDVAASHLVYEKAKEAGIGSTFRLHE